LAEQNDDQLMSLYNSGSMPAFELLYARHRAPLYRFFNRQMNHAQAQDAFQETWSKLIAGAARYQPKGLFTAFLFRLAHNVLVDQQRKRMRSPLDQLSQGVQEDGQIVDPDSLNNSMVNVERQVMHAEAQKKLYDTLAALPLNQRTVWLLKQESVLTLAQIAELTETSLEGVKSRLRYANEKLRAGLQRYVR